MEDKIKILIVDDDETMVEVTTAGLEVDGFEVSFAFNGKKGIEKVEEVHPDVVLLDLRLPDIDGFEVLKKIKAKPENSAMHVIMITGDRTIDIDKAFALGADDCIIKPIDMKYLVSRIWVLTKKQYRVMVVEDDRQISEMIKNALEKQGYGVSVHYDGKNIIEVMKKAKPDVLLLDISLPVGPDGIELCKTVKADPSNKALPVIMLTANEYASSVDKCFSFGASDYIFKPFYMPDLLAKIKKYLRISTRNQ